MYETLGITSGLSYFGHQICLIGWPTDRKELLIRLRRLANPAADAFFHDIIVLLFTYRMAGKNVIKTR
jgi:hypothetical protein